MEPSTTSSSPAAPASAAAPSAAAPAASAPSPSSRRLLGGFVLFVLLAFAAVWGWNEVTVSGPVRRALAQDPRNAGYTLTARHEHHVVPSVLVLDLTAIESAAPVDIWRGLMQSAEALAERDRTFERVVLAREGRAIFVMQGDDFRTLGREYGAGQNPIYLLRTLPQTLYDPATGRAAYGTWTGGWLGVASRQMEDLNSAAEAWMLGSRP